MKERVRDRSRYASDRPQRSRRCASVLAICVSGLCSPILTAQAAEDLDSSDGTKNVNVVEEVVVTARRREESLQEVAISISAVSQDEINRNNLKTLTDLQYFVPSMGVTAGNTGRNHPRVSLRGVNGRVTDGQAVVSYLNEVSLPPGNQNETGGGVGLMHDLESVQVLKGPQGTLFGKNSIGGAILYESKRPTNDLEGYFELGIGNYNSREVRGAINFPVIDDKLLVRVALNGAQRDGFTDSLGTANHPNGIDLDDRDYKAGRVSVRFGNAESVKNDLIFDYVADDTHGLGAIITQVNPDSFGVFLFPEVIDQLASQTALGIRTQVPTNTHSGGETRFWSVTDILEWDISDSLTFRNIAGYNKFKTQFFGDWDGTLSPIISSSVGGLGPPAETPYYIETYSEEAQLLGESLGGKLNWIVGGIYSHYPKQDSPNGAFAVEIFGGLGGSGGKLAQTSTNAGIYGQATYEFTDALSFTGGYRYSRDKIEIKEGGFEEASFSPSSWTLGLDYKVSDDTLLYLASRRGYHAGGINDIQSTEPVPYDPEFVTDVELGLKSDWTIGDMDARTNISIYYSSYTDFQAQQIELIGTELVTLFQNAGEAEIAGAEFDGTFYPTENLELTAQYSYLYFNYVEIEPGVNAALLEATIRGNGPEHRYSLGGRWSLTNGDAMGDFSLWAHWGWQSDTLLRYALHEQPSYGLLNLGVDWNRVFGHPFDVSFAMTNVNDKEYGIGGYSFVSGALAAVGTQVTIFGEPRMYVFSVRYLFGE